MGVCSVVSLKLVAMIANFAQCVKNSRDGHGQPAFSRLQAVDKVLNCMKTACLWALDVIIRPEIPKQHR